MIGVSKNGIFYDRTNRQFESGLMSQRYPATFSLEPDIIKAFSDVFNPIERE